MESCYMVFFISKRWGKIVGCEMAIDQHW